MKLLFIDIDGVLNKKEKHYFNQYYGINNQCMCILNELIEETDCKLVICSAWRYLVLNKSMTLDGFKYLLFTHGLTDLYGNNKDLIHGVTRRDTFPLFNEDRADAVIEYMKDLDVKSYCCIDDLDLGYTDRKLNFVHINGKIGLQNRDADLVIEILNKGK